MICNDKFNKFLLISFAALAFMFALNNANQPAKAESNAKFKTHVVNISSSAFSSRTLTIRAGDTVVWRNKDIVPHTATGKGFDSGNLKSGASWSFVFKKKGNYSYICTYHPTMKGTIIVK
jgi:plastocyanin